MRQVRKLRHWKQQWDKNAAFVWRRAILWNGEKTVPGDPIPQSLRNNPSKLRRFWESQQIELAEFETPKNVLSGQDEGYGSNGESSDSVEQAEAPSEHTEPEAPAAGTGEPEVKKDGSQYVIEGVPGKFRSKKAALDAWKAAQEDDDELA